MVKRLLAPVVAFLLPLLLALPAGAGVPVPPAPGRYVTDRAGVLGDAVVRKLETRLRDFEAQTSNQLLVYLEPELPEGTTLEEYTVAAAQAWRAGDEERKNGVVLFVFPRSRAARIEVGYGLEGALPDAVAARIVRDEMVPRFQKGEWNGGVLAGVDAVVAATKGEYKGKARPRLRARGSLPPELLFLLVFFVLPLLFGRRRRGFWWMGGGGFGGGSFGGWSGGGGGGFVGGGGTFGGGGASGRW